jgi:hypothetical protein
MVKDKSTVIEEFNDLVNMTPNELRAWLKEEQSQSSGWRGASASASGETVGHERYSSFSCLPVWMDSAEQTDVDDRTAAAELWISSNITPPETRLATRTRI